MLQIYSFSPDLYNRMYVLAKTKGSQSERFENTKEVLDVDESKIGFIVFDEMLESNQKALDQFLPEVFHKS